MVILKKVFTFGKKSCIVFCEQSRRPRVKCHRDGELPGGRRIRIPRWGHRTRCCIWDILLDCSNDTRSGGGFGWGTWGSSDLAFPLCALSLLPFSTSDLKSVQLPDAKPSGSFFAALPPGVWVVWGQQPVYPPQQ